MSGFTEENYDPELMDTASGFDPPRRRKRQHFLFHAIFDGTRFCRCSHSQYMKALALRRRIG